MELFHFWLSSFRKYRPAKLDQLLNNLMKYWAYGVKLPLKPFVLHNVNFKSSLINLKSVKIVKKIFLKMSRNRNIVFYDLKSQFLVVFFSSYLHPLVFKIPFSDHKFSKISNFIFFLLANTTPSSIANLIFYMPLVPWYVTYFNILST